MMDTRTQHAICVGVIATLWIVMPIWLTAIITVVYFAALYIGVFHVIEFEDGLLTERTVAAIEVVGPYKNLGAAFEWMKRTFDDHDDSARMLGFYYDNPNEVPDEECRSLVCVELEPEQPLPDGIDDRFTLRKIDIPTVPITCTQFPFRKWIAMVSIITGVIRVYPALHKHMATAYADCTTGGPCCELYGDTSIIFSNILDRPDALEWPSK